MTSGLDKDLVAGNEDLKRYFFTLVSANKKLLGEKHLGYYINTNKMFLFAINKPVPLSDWPKFVTEEMSQRAEQWKDDSQLRKIHLLFDTRASSSDLM